MRIHQIFNVGILFCVAAILYKIPYSANYHGDPLGQNKWNLLVYFIIPIIETLISIEPKPRSKQLAGHSALQSPS